MTFDAAHLYETLGTTLRDRRNALGLTQSQVAHSVGVRRTSVANVEAGKQRPPLHVLYSWMEALDVEPADVLPHPAELRAARPEPVSVEGLDEAVPPRTAEILTRLLRG